MVAAAEDKKTISSVKNIKILIIFFCLALLIAVFLTRGFGFFQSGQIDSEDFIQIPLSEVIDQAKWYEYDLDGKEIKFFTVKTEDGNIKTAFDACDVCYYSGKGYRQEGDYMVCNNCGNKYPISGLGTENKTPGGCWPGYLPNTVEGDSVVIKIKDLADNTWRTL